MVELDDQIGRNLAQLRGAMSQQQLADRMRERGWKWSQSTVWAIEQGGRPVRLAEAADLARVLDLGEVGIDVLVRPDGAVSVQRAIEQMARAQDAVADAVREYVTGQHALAVEADLAGPLPEDVHARAMSWLRPQVVELARAAERDAVSRYSGEVGPTLKHLEARDFSAALERAWRGIASDPCSV